MDRYVTSALGCAGSWSDIAVYRLPDNFGPRGLLVLDRELAGKPVFANVRTLESDHTLIMSTPHQFGRYRRSSASLLDGRYEPGSGLEYGPGMRM